MSEEENPGCLAIGCSIWFLLSILTLIIYFIANDSIDAVQEISISDISYLTMIQSTGTGSNNAKKMNEMLMSEFEKLGIDTNKDLEDALSDNKYIKNVKFEVRDDVKVAKDVDTINVSFIVEKNNVEIPVTIMFLVQPKSLLDHNLTKFLMMVNVSIETSKGVIEYGDREAMTFISHLYHEDLLGQLIDELLAKLNNK